MDSLIINGVELVTTPLSYTINSLNVVWTASTVSYGITYLNFYYFIQEIITNFGLTGYQVEMYKDKYFSVNNNGSATKLIFPCADTFQFKFYGVDNNGGDQNYFIYNQNGVFDWFLLPLNPLYHESSCQVCTI